MAYPSSYEKYLTTLTNRETFMGTIDRFLSDYDVFLCPVHTTAAYTHIPADSYFGPYPLYKQDFSVDDAKLGYMMANGAYTTIFNLTGNPVVTLPVGHTQENLPIGIQVVGARWHDMKLLQDAGQLDRIAHAYSRPPGF